jgi:hypothetical protein
MTGAVGFRPSHAAFDNEQSADGISATTVESSAPSRR